MDFQHKAHEVVDGLGRKARDYWKSVIEGRSQGHSDIASEEQLAYANLLDLTMRLGLAWLVTVFAIYVLGLREPHIPFEDITRYWTMPVHEYLAASKVPTGWGWLALVSKSDFMCFLPIAFLSAVTIACYARILPILVAKRDRVFIAIASAEIAVLVLAASGILVGGH